MEGRREGREVDGKEVGGGGGERGRRRGRMETASLQAIKNLPKVWEMEEAKIS